MTAAAATPQTRSLPPQLRLAPAGPAHQRDHSGNAASAIGDQADLQKHVVVDGPQLELGVKVLAALQADAELGRVHVAWVYDIRVGRFLRLGLAVAALLPAQTAEYQLAPTQGSRLALEAFKTGLMRGKKHLFEFSRYRGRLLYNAARPEASQVELTIEVANCDLKDTWLSPKDFQKVQRYALHDMLAAERYPEITFTSTAVRPRPDGQFDVDGTLVIRGLARPARVLVAVRPGPILEGSARVHMTTYGLKPPSAALGAVGTKDEMLFSFLLRPS